MMRLKDLLSLLLVLSVAAVPLFANGAQPSGGASGPTPISIFMTTHGRTYDASLPNIQEIMRKTNTVLDVVRADGTDALNLLFASNDLPDLVEFTSMNFQLYLGTGYLQPLDDLLKNYGQNIQKTTSEEAWNLVTIQGKIYALPFENNQIKHYTSARTDWLESVRIDLSGHADYGKFGGKVITLDEYREILRRFTRNDPDKNGQNDTYGLGAYARKTNNGWHNIYGAFGGIPGQYYIANDKVMPWVVTDQYHQALSYINSLWTEGVIDPEIFLAASDQAQQKMINGSAGSLVGECWSAAFELQINGLQRLKPESDFISLWLTSNDGKTFGTADNGLLTNTWSITTQSRNPEKVMSFMDFFTTDEGWLLAWYGLPVEDYNMEGGFPIRTELGNTRYNNMILDSLYTLGNRLDLLNLAAQRPLTEWSQLLRQKWEILQQDNSQPSYTSAFYGIPDPAAFNEYGVDVNNWIEQSAMSFIIGETPINDANWNNYINTWKRMGGVKILQGYIDEYNNIRGTKVTAGITE